MNSTIKKEMIIIGNGPSAITLSFMLAGNWPYYDEKKGHPNEKLHCRLIDEDDYNDDGYIDLIDDEYYDDGGGGDGTASNEEISDGEQSGGSSCFGSDLDVAEDIVDASDAGYCRLNNYLDIENNNAQLPILKKKSIIERDLEYLSSGIQGRSINPISNLFDSLLHPEADICADIPSPLYWNHLEEKCVDHLVIGEGLPGGAWYKMDDCKKTLTISIGNWMQLPGLNIKQWNNQMGREESRLSFSCVAKYYKDYVEKQNLSKYFLNNSKVTQIYYKRKQKLWHLIGYTKPREDNNNNLEEYKVFHYVTPKVVLATGCSSKPNKLDIPGEEEKFILHSLNELEDLLSNKSARDIKDPIMIVGSGLSAADAIIATNLENIPVIHVFRRHPEDPSLIFNQLPETLYPEYHQVHKQMLGRVNSKIYKSYSMHSLIDITSDRQATLKNLINDNMNQVTSYKVIKVSYILILIGMKPNLNFIQPKLLRAQLTIHQTEPLDSRKNPIKINQITHECIAAPGLYAMGPLVGDNFVRFLQGGALAITSHLWQERNRKKIKDSNS